MRRLALAVMGAVLLACAAPTCATAETCRPLNAGGMVFSQINRPEDPEDYCYEVNLSEEEELRQIDERTVQVFQSGGFPSFTITATEASDAEGATVPTTLAKTGRNLVTLTVHHREGNPATGGAPFHYPVVDGAGWEGGFQPVVIQGPPDESELKSKPSPPVAEEPAPQCDVPALQGRTLRAARLALERADCRLGPVRGKRRRGARVAKQYRRYGAVLPAGTEVGVRLKS